MSETEISASTSNMESAVANQGEAIEESRLGAPAATFSPANGADLQATAETAVDRRLVPESSAAAGVVQPFVYALGRIEPRFPTLAVEKEFAQVAGRSDTAALTDRQMVQRLLSERQNRYLARQLCWTFMVEGIETFILQPRDPLDTDLLVDSLRSTPRADDVDVVIGLLGPIAPPELCNALMVPVVLVDQVYSFDVDSLIASIPRPRQIKQEQFQTAADELFHRIMQLADNAGVTDADRALNYLAVRYPAIYHLTTERFAQDATLSGVDVLPSRLSATRRIVDVIFSYTDRKTDVTDKSFVRVDVTEEFPFLVTKLSPYFDRTP